MKKMYTLALAGLIVSCSSKISYVGNKYTPTENVDVYVDAAAIKKSYDIVGKGYTDRINFRQILNQQLIQDLAIKKAKTNGADAVWFREYYIYQNGTHINGTVRIDTVFRGVVYSANSSIVNQPYTLMRDILFLKYK